MEVLRFTVTSLVQHARRPKYIIVAAVLFIGLCIFISKPAEEETRPRIPDDQHDFIIKSDNEGTSRFNRENVSMFDLGLLEETRKKWIIAVHDSSIPYNLDQPDLADPSMGQAAAVNRVLKNMTNGFFIECGAYDGETRSNTLFFERYLNWSGLLIEADPVNFEKVVRKNRRAYLSNTCLSTKKYPVLGSFLMADNIGRLHSPHESNDEESEYLKNTADVAHRGEHRKVQCLPVATYVAALEVKRVDYFSLDIEGLEPEVLETIPFELIDIRMLSVEFSHNKKSRDYLSTMMEKRGYEVVDLITHPQNLANDLIFVKKSFKNSIA